ncbi:MAG: arylsulfatase [Bacteroidota bacterium]
MVASCATGGDGANTQNQQKDTRPNIVLIMGDDIGFSDLGCYGSEIATPNLDRLARNGLRFQRFYNMAKCNPTRSTMITGLYEGNERALSFVPLLRAAGYSAIMSGKEHFDNWVPKDCYFANTFENSLTFWATTEYFVPPSGKFERPFYLNGKELAAHEIEAEILPKYKTDFITDYGLKWLDEVMKRDQPFFFLLPYHSAHYPLQARPEDIAKYHGRYKKGWDAIRHERFERMKKLGVIAETTQLAPPSSNTNRFRGHPKGFDALREAFPKYVPWTELTEAEKDKKDLEMAVFAAMIDRMDQNIGRVLDRLEAAGELDNTLILFFTDNGSCPFDSNVDFDVPPGPANSYRCLSAAWATVGNTPFRLFKQNGHEGGSNTHFIAHWPEVIAPNQITEQIGHVADLFPTFLELAFAKYPDVHKGKPTLPLDGQSLVPIFKGAQKTENAHYLSGLPKFRMFRKGDWKIVRENGGDWELYNMKKDPTELNNLAATQAQKLKEIVAAFDAYESKK